ncbi:MAG: TonB-dependent receptor [Bacteroidales bacterium]|jgi:hypothetical protein|nr:TonB-dependent receptor [Bacteroidales bacterium]MCI2122452.1 TonB-dependent receptor [Bacteroidales bacterium]MCI2145108.1 TonB-dependent receptor [Bacteroidales bacterium]
MKRLLLFFLLLAGCLAANPDRAVAQTGYSGGVKGTIVGRVGRAPIKNALVTIVADKIHTVYTGDDGAFEVDGLPDGMFKMTVEAANYYTVEVNLKVENGLVNNVYSITLSPQSVVRPEIDDSYFMEQDTDNERGYQDVPSILSSTADVYDNIAGYTFSAIRFHNRGYESASEDIYLNGIRMNDAMSGYTPWSLWSGLNEATRSKENAHGITPMDYGIGRYNGMTGIFARASSVRKGYRFSVLNSSGQYRFRVMGTYASGIRDDGWSYAVSASTRQGGNAYVTGVYYNSLSYYAGVEKRFGGDRHVLSLSFLGAPVERGAQNASTQEVYDIMGSNYYNSNWGYQRGKVRNARVRRNHEPVAVLNYDFKPSEKFQLSSAVSFRFGKNGYSALDWYDTQDPRPDYYRNLPSYFPDNESKAAWCLEGWKTNTDISHINWDRLYNVNYLSYDGRSKYAVEERRTDQRDLNAQAGFIWNIDAFVKLTGGYAFRTNRTEYFKVMRDLLGGSYWLDVDQFAERDYGSGDAIQNDLNNPDRKVTEGEKYGYDYYAHFMENRAWAKFSFEKGGFEGFVAGQGGYTTFNREGLYKKGLFPDDSYGAGETQAFPTFTFKGGLMYKIGTQHVFSANAGYFTDAPDFKQSYVSPRTRNDVVPDLGVSKTVSADLNYTMKIGEWFFRITGFYTVISDQTKTISFYDDINRTYTNFSMTGIDQANCGLEMGASIPLKSGFSLQAAASVGDYRYTSNPEFTETVDNSAKVIVSGEKVYWKGSYVASTPQTALDIGLKYRSDDYWFAGIDCSYFDRMYLDMNPLARTDAAKAEYYTVYYDEDERTAAIAKYLTSQEEFSPAFLVNANVGKSWYVFHNYNLGFSLQVNNILNNCNIKTGGYEQMRLKTQDDGTYARFDSRYFYMFGTTYMVNIYLRF